MCICLVSGDMINENYQFFMTDVAFSVGAIHHLNYVGNTIVLNKWINYLRSLATVYYEMYKETFKLP